MQNYNYRTFKILARELAKGYLDMQASKEMWLDAETDVMARHWKRAYDRDEARYRAQSEMCLALGLGAENKAFEQAWLKAQEELKQEAA